MDNCKFCKQVKAKCPCDKVDRFFADNWDLKYVWQDRCGAAGTSLKFAYVVPKIDKRKQAA